MPSELRELVDQCIANDQSAVIQLVQRFRWRVFSLCYRMLGQHQDAEDAMQETFIRVFRSLPRWDSHRAFEPWLFQIAANRCRTLLARRNRRPTSEAFNDHLVIDPAAEQWQAHDQLAEEVALALETLKPEWKDAFLMFHRHEMSYVEIAQALDCPVGTVKTWVHRARQELIERLKQRKVV
jgi:RNA polymerase sigma-70 factor (ECF subfamily)